MKLFHRHNWDLIDKTIIPPAVDELPGGTKAQGTGMAVLFDALREHVVYLFKCECGKIKIEKR